MCEPLNSQSNKTPNPRSQILLRANQQPFEILDRPIQRPFAPPFLALLSLQKMAQMM
jgi:hypothetical protein